MRLTRGLQVFKWPFCNKRLLYAELDDSLSKSERGRNFFFTVSRDLIWVSYISQQRISFKQLQIFMTWAKSELSTVSYPRSSLASQVSYLGAFTYWRKGLLASSGLIVSLSGHVYLLGSRWTGFRDIRCWGLFENLWRKIEIMVKSDKNVGHLREYLSRYYYYYCWRRQVAINALLIATCR